MSVFSRPYDLGICIEGQISPSAADDCNPKQDTSTEDTVWVERVLLGEREAEEFLYRRHGPSVLRLAKRLLRNKQDALDVFQDAFVHAFEDLKSLREPANFGAWVHQIAMRLVQRRFRRRRMLTWLGFDENPEDVSLESMVDYNASPEVRAEFGWLDQALRRIDDRDRMAWVLRHVEGLKLPEVASACECSLATAKRRIAAAETAIQRHLQGGL